MTDFTIPLPDAIKRLEEAAKAVDEVVSWDTTDAGPDFWEDMHQTLVDTMKEARNQAGQPTPAPTPTRAGIMPPLPTPAIGGNNKTKGLPPLHELMKGGQRKSTGTASPSTNAQEDIVHIWNTAGSMCGLGGTVTSWPPGHYRVNPDEASKATCPTCRAKMKEVATA